MRWMNRLMFLSSVIRGHVHKEEGWEQFGDGSSEFVNNGTNEEQNTEEIEIETQELEEVQLEEVQLEETQLKEAQSEEIQSEEIQSEEVQSEEAQSEEAQSEKAQSEEVQSEEIQSEEIQLETWQQEIQFQEEGLVKETVLEEEGNSIGSETRVCVIVSEDTQEELIQYAIQIEDNETDQVEELTYMLPETGGQGVQPYWQSGLLCICFALLIRRYGCILHKYIFRVCLINHYCQKTTSFHDLFRPHSVEIARYTSLIRGKTSRKMMNFLT